MHTKWGRRALSYSESILSTQGCLYTFAALYIITNILVFLRQAVVEGRNHTNFRRYTTAIARGCGATINFNIALVLLLASRSILGFLRETPLSMVLPIDQAMPDFHRLVGIFTLFAAILHVICHIPWYVIESPWSPEFNGATSLFITGLFLLMLMVVVRLVARPAVYHSNYELFFRMHVGGSFLIYSLIIIHGMNNGVPNSWKWVIGPIIIYVLDVAFRAFREKRSYLLVSKHSAAFQGPNIVKIRLPRVFHFEAGQYAEIKVPHLSRFQWHPFTIASAPHEPEIVFYIKAVGDWTKSLYALFADRLSDENADDIEVHIRGPYGAPAQHVGQFDRVILIGGGVGATPFCSVVKDAYNWIKHWKPRRARRQQRNQRHGGEGEEPSRLHTRGAQAGITRMASTPSDGESDSSHLFTTNVISERLWSDESIGMEEYMTGVNGRQRRRHGIEWARDALSEDNDFGTIGDTTMYTARDQIIPLESDSTESSSPSGESPNGNEKRAEKEKNSGDIETGESGGVERESGKIGERVRGKVSLSGSRKGEDMLDRRRKSSSRRKVIRGAGEDDMGSYYANSTGSHHRSMDYMTALHSVYMEEDMNEVFQRSLDLMVTMSFGSMTLVRSLQKKHALRNATQPAESEGARTDVSVGLFRQRRIMLLLLLRSVTVNMVILWLLVIRFTMAGAGYCFGVLRLFRDGVALYDVAVLTGVDLVAGLWLTLLIGLPCVVEMVELGSMPVHGMDLFVLAPLALLSVIVDGVALGGGGKDVDALFSILHVLVVWPLLTVLVGVRLLRVIGERIAQTEKVERTHATTRAVDFYWTAPTREDDAWLVGELGQYTDVREVRLHRYLTREKAQGNGTGSDTGMVETNQGRPNWEELLNETAEGCRNNTTVGVFFCGPQSMGLMIEEACLGAMRNSIVRGLQRGARAMRGLEEIFGDAVSANEYTGESCDLSARRGRGCNVTFVFKRESFS